MPKRPNSGKSAEAILAYIKEGQRLAEQSKVLSEQSARCFYVALDLLTTEYLDSIYGFVKGSLSVSKQAWAEDITQEVFLAAYKAMPEFKQKSSIATWLWRIAKYKCVDAVRKKNEATPTASEDDGIPPSSQTERENNEGWEAIQNYLKKLPINDRLVIALRIHGTLTAKEIAEILGVQMVSLRQKYRRAIERLKHSIKDDDGI